MSGIDYNEIKQWIEHGRIKQIAKEHDIQPNAASKIFGGHVKRPNVKFLNALIDEALTNKRMLMEKQRALKEMKVA